MCQERGMMPDVDLIITSCQLNLILLSIRELCCLNLRLSTMVIHY